VAHDEGDERDVGLAVAEIEFEWDVALEHGGGDFVMDEDGAEPIGEEEWLATDREQAAAGGFAEAGPSLS